MFTFKKGQFVFLILKHMLLGRKLQNIIKNLMKLLTFLLKIILGYVKKNYETYIHC